MFNLYNTLGFMSPYFRIVDGKINVYNNFRNAVDTIDHKVLDITAIIEAISTGQCIGDRTLINGISKSPWMAKPSSDMLSWEYDDVPQHKEIIYSEKIIAEELYKKITEEIRQFCINKSTIGILLSGGMDSRIVALILYEIIRKEQLNIKVATFTWGQDNSRDVIYAEKIAKALGWDSIHLKLSPETLWNNIEIAAELGCEFSPVHLHSIAQLREIKGIDGILAGSFGDSIGRGEYSSVHISKCKPMDLLVHNKYSILKNDLFKSYRKEVQKDFEIYWHLFPRDKQYQKIELDLQIHYLRRKLNSCMSYINEKIPVYQMFTAKSVFGFMWSIAPYLRTDRIYYYIMLEAEKVFMEVPWARTGKGYLAKTGVEDNYNKMFHEYGNWIRNGLHDYIRKKVLSQEISQLGIFNMDSLDYMIKANKRISNSKNCNQIDQLLIWLASLSVMVKMYNITEVNMEHKYNNATSNFSGKLETLKYLIARRYLRND